MKTVRFKNRQIFFLGYSKLERLVVSTGHKKVKGTSSQPVDESQCFQ